MVQWAGYPTSASKQGKNGADMDRLNPSQRRTYSLVEYADQEAEVWKKVLDLEARANVLFPPGWMAEIRITQEGHLGFPRCFKLLCYSAYTLGGSPFKMEILSPATSRSDLGCWIPRAFRVTRPTP